MGAAPCRSAADGPGSDPQPLVALGYDAHRAELDAAAARLHDGPVQQVTIALMTVGLAAASATGDLATLLQRAEQALGEAATGLRDELDELTSAASAQRWLTAMLRVILDHPAASDATAGGTFAVEVAIADPEAVPTAAICATVADLVARGHLEVRGPRRTLTIDSDHERTVVTVSSAEPGSRPLTVELAPAR